MVKNKIMLKANKIIKDFFDTFCELMSKENSKKCVKHIFKKYHASRFVQSKKILADMGYILCDGLKIYLTKKIKTLNLYNALLDATAAKEAFTKNNTRKKD